MRFQSSYLYLLLFFSGAAGLGYEMVWTRMLSAAPGHEIIAVLAAIHRVAAAFLHAHQLHPAFIKLVVAHGVVVQADHIEGFDGRFVMEERRKQRAGADHIAGRDHHRVGIERAQRVNVRGQVFCPSSKGCTYSPAGS